MELSKFAKVSLLYTGTKYVVTGVNALRGFFIAFYLGPELLGTYGLVLIVLEYLNYANLGVFYSLNKEVAIKLGQDVNRDFINKNMNTALTFQFINSLFIAVVTFIFYLYIDSVLTPFIPFIIILGCLYALKTFLIIYFRLFEIYEKIIKMELFSSLLILFFVILLNKNLGVQEIFAISIFVNLLFIIPYLYEIKSFKFFIDFSILKNLIWTGIPLLFFNLFVLLITSIDRVVIGSRSTYNLEVMGYYHFGYLLAFGVFTAFNTLAFLALPKILKQQHNSIDTELLINQSKIIEIFVILISSIAIILVPLVIKNFLPDYLISIKVMQLLLLGYILNAYAFIPANYLIANGYNSILIGILLISVSIGYVLNINALDFGLGIYGVALATVATFTIYSLGIFYFYLRKHKNKITINIFKLFWKLGVFILLSSYLLWENINPSYLIFLIVLLYFFQVKNIFKKSLNLNNL